MYRLNFPPSFVAHNGAMYLQMAIVPGKHNLKERQTVLAVIGENEPDFETLRAELYLVSAYTVESPAKIQPGELEDAGYANYEALTLSLKNQTDYFSETEEVTVIRFSCVPESLQELKKWESKNVKKENRRG